MIPLNELTDQPIGTRFNYDYREVEIVDSNTQPIDVACDYCVFWRNGCSTSDSNTNFERS